jgi:hypothetical protein
MAGDMTFHQWFATLPRPFWCPICEAPVTRWHEHWGPRRIWRPGMVEPVIRGVSE